MYITRNFELFVHLIFIYFVTHLTVSPARCENSTDKLERIKELIEVSKMPEEEAKKVIVFLESIGKVKIEADAIKLFLTQLQSNPKNIYALNALSLLYMKIDDNNNAAKYAEMALEEKINNRNLEICATIYILARDQVKLESLLPKIVKQDKITPHLMRVILACAERNKDPNLLLMAIGKLDDENCKDERVVSGLKSVAKTLREQLFPEK